MSLKSGAKVQLIFYTAKRKLGIFASKPSFMGRFHLKVNVNFNFFRIFFV